MFVEIVTMINRHGKFPHIFFKISCLYLEYYNIYYIIVESLLYNVNSQLSLHEQSRDNQHTKSHEESLQKAD